jgi:RES domain
LPARAALPAPPDELDPLVHEWPEGAPIVRCHPDRYGPREFNRSTAPGRFRPVRSGGRIVGSLYGSEDAAGAVSETVFRAAPVGPGPKRVSRALLGPLLLSTLAPRRTLRLASLHGHGLRRLGATRAQLIESEPDRYPELAAWGQALHDCPARPDGIVWRSRHYDDSFALVLFADRVPGRALDVIEPPLPPAVGRGLERVQELAERAGITLVQ